MNKKQVYLILGAAGSGRREVIADLVSDPIEEGRKVVTLLSRSEQESAMDKHLGQIERYVWNNEHRFAPEIPADAEEIFVVADGRQNPVDLIEAFRDWLGSSDCELARIFCVVNCQLAERVPEVIAWYDVCIHFADVVLLNRREGVGNKWMSDFVTRYQKQYLPCLFEMVKGGRVKNPAMILEPVARRISQAFDEEINVDLKDVIIEDEDGEELDAKAKAELEEDEALSPKVDPYFARKLGGRRVKEVPDIAALLQK